MSRDIRRAEAALAPLRALVETWYADTPSGDGERAEGFVAAERFCADELSVALDAAWELFLEQETDLECLRATLDEIRGSSRP